jgi:hypothetical protein
MSFYALDADGPHTLAFHESDEAWAEGSRCLVSFYQETGLGRVSAASDQLHILGTPLCIFRLKIIWATENYAEVMHV